MTERMEGKGDSWEKRREKGQTLSCVLHCPLFVPVGSGTGSPSGTFRDSWKTPLAFCPSLCCQYPFSIFSLSSCSFSQDFLAASESRWFRVSEFFYWSRLEEDVHSRDALSRGFRLRIGPFERQTMGTKNMIQSFRTGLVQYAEMTRIGYNWSHVPEIKTRYVRYENECQATWPGGVTWQPPHRCRVASVFVVHALLCLGEMTEATAPRATPRQTDRQTDRKVCSPTTLLCRSQRH